MTTAGPDTAQAAIQSISFDRLGATRLYLDFLCDFDRVRAVFGPSWDDLDAAENLTARISARSYERAKLAAILEELADDYHATRNARNNISRLRSDDALVVFAGQQAGLFTGPLYTIYKALCTERWAQELEERLHRPVVPCFWLSTDDHDFAEVDHVYLPAGDELRKIRYAPACAPDGDPVGRVVITREIEQVLAELEGGLPATEFKAGVFETLRQCYAPGQRFASAFGRLWARLFPESGLVPVSPCHRGLKLLARPLLEAALSDDTALFQLYEDASRRLVEAGYHQQVHKTDRQTFLFYQQFKRHSLHHDGQGGYVWEGAEPVTADWLKRTIHERPDYFSPNVLLRPVVQNGLFPTLGVVLGPSETAYYAQIGGIHDHFGVPRPMIMPRTSVTQVERSVRKRVDKHGIRLDELHRDVNAEVARVLRQSFPQDLGARFDAASRQVGEAFESVRPGLVGFDPTLDKPARMAQARAEREMHQLARKAHAAHKRREEETEAQIRRLALQLYPRGGLQERSFNIVYYWARYGPDFLAQLSDGFPVGMRGHLLRDV